MTGWPSRSLIFGIMRRARMSMPPPGGNPIMMRMGRLGKVCAQVERTRSGAVTAPIRNRRRVLEKGIGLYPPYKRPTVVVWRWWDYGSNRVKVLLTTAKPRCPPAKGRRLFRVPNWRIAALHNSGCDFRSVLEAAHMGGQQDYGDHDMIDSLHYAPLRIG